ncbi:hypothetical protein DFAR_2210072 [Desulfarculales bacterium]
MLRWVRKGTSVRAAQWRITHVTRHALKCIVHDTKTLTPVLKALMTLKKLVHLILTRWTSNRSSAAWRGLTACSKPLCQKTEATVMPSPSWP